jgi:putative transposase
MPMKKSHFTEEQIAYALRQAETGTAVTEVCRAMGISEQTYYRCKSLDKLMLQDVLAKKL